MSTVLAESPPRARGAPSADAAPSIVPIVERGKASGAVLAWLDRHRRPMFAMVALGLLAGFNGQWRIDPDSALYLTLGRSLARGEGYSYHGQPHNLVYPGLPLAIAAAFRLAGDRAIVLLNAAVLLLALAAIALTYRLVRGAFGRPTAVIVALMTAVAHGFARYAYSVLVDLPFLVAVLATLAGFEAVFRSPARPSRADWLLFAGGVASATLLKPMMLPLLAIGPLCAPWRSMDGPRRARCAAATLGIVAIVAAFFCLDPRHPVSSDATSYERLAARQLTQLPQRWDAGAIAENARDLFGESISFALLGISLGHVLANAAFAAVVLASTAALLAARPMRAIWVAATLAKSLCFHSDARYLLPILPFLALGWWRVIEAATRPLGRAWGGVAVAAFLAVSVGPNVMRNLALLAEQRAPTFLDAYKRGRDRPIVEMAARVRGATPADAVILAPPNASRIVTYLADRTAIGDGDPAVSVGDRPIFAIVAADGPVEPSTAARLARLGARPLDAESFRTVAAPALALRAAARRQGGAIGYARAAP